MIDETIEDARLGNQFEKPSSFIGLGSSLPIGTYYRSKVQTSIMGCNTFLHIKRCGVQMWIQIWRKKKNNGTKSHLNNLNKRN